MADLSSPIELLDSTTQRQWQFRVTKVERGTLTINPRDGRPPKTINALRLFVPPTDKATFPPYYDVTSTRLVAQLGELLAVPANLNRMIKIKAIGFAPETRFEIQLL